METRTMHTQFYQDFEIESTNGEIRENSPHHELTRLALAAASGNLQAYQSLVNHPAFLASLTKTSKWMCRHSAIEGDELLSEFFLRLPNKIRKYSARHGASIVSWCGGVLRHLHIDMLRRQWRDTDRVEYMDLVAIEHERSVEAADSKLALQQAFSRLSDREKKLLELRRSEETLDEIVIRIDGLTDPRDIQNRRPRISRELKAVEQKLQLALSAVNSARLQGRRSPQKAEY
jgi:RNA polymerase sigma factor (sigma-70 family)